MGAVSAREPPGNGQRRYRFGKPGTEFGVIVLFAFARSTSILAIVNFPKRGASYDIESLIA
jgi:hypothetical protein